MNKLLVRALLALTMGFGCDLISQEAQKRSIPSYQLRVYIPNTDPKSLLLLRIYDRRNIFDFYQRIGRNRYYDSSQQEYALGTPLLYLKVHSDKNKINSVRKKDGIAVPLEWLKDKNEGDTLTIVLKKGRYGQVDLILANDETIPQASGLITLLIEQCGSQQLHTFHDTVPFEYRLEQRIGLLKMRTRVNTFQNRNIFSQYTKEEKKKLREDSDSFIRNNGTNPIITNNAVKFLNYNKKV